MNVLYKDVGIFKCKTMYQNKSSLMRHFGIVVEYVTNYRSDNSSLVYEIINDFNENLGLIGGGSIFTDLNREVVQSIIHLLNGFVYILTRRKKEHKTLYTIIKKFEKVIGYLRNDYWKNSTSAIKKQKEYSIIINSKLYKLISLLIILYNLKLETPLDRYLNLISVLPHFDNSYVSNNSKSNTKSIKEMFQNTPSVVKKVLNRYLFIHNNNKSDKYIPLGCLYISENGPYLYKEDIFNNKPLEDINFSLNNFILSETSLVGLFILLINNNINYASELMLNSVASAKMPALFFKFNEYYDIAYQYIENVSLCDKHDPGFSENDDYAPYKGNFINFKYFKYQSRAEEEAKAGGVERESKRPDAPPAKREDQDVDFTFENIGFFFNFKPNKIKLSFTNYFDELYTYIKSDDRRCLKVMIEIFKKPDPDLKTGLFLYLSTINGTMRFLNFFVNKYLDDERAVHTRFKFFKYFYKIINFIYYFKNEHYFELEPKNILIEDFWPKLKQLYKCSPAFIAMSGDSYNNMKKTIIKWNEYIWKNGFKNNNYNITDIIDFLIILFPKLTRFRSTFILTKGLTSRHLGSLGKNYINFSDIPVPGVEWDPTIKKYVKDKYIQINRGTFISFCQSCMVLLKKIINPYGPVLWDLLNEKIIDKFSASYSLPLTQLKSKKIDISTENFFKLSSDLIKNYQTLILCIRAQIMYFKEISNTCLVLINKIVDGAKQANMKSFLDTHHNIFYDGRFHLSMAITGGNVHARVTNVRMSKTAGNSRCFHLSTKKIFQIYSNISAKNEYDLLKELHHETNIIQNFKNMSDQELGYRIGNFLLLLNKINYLQDDNNHIEWNNVVNCKSGGYYQKYNCKTTLGKIMYSDRNIIKTTTTKNKKNIVNAYITPPMFETSINLLRKIYAVEPSAPANSKSKLLKIFYNITQPILHRQKYHYLNKFLAGRYLQGIWKDLPLYPYSDQTTYENFTITCIRSHQEVAINIVKKNINLIKINNEDYNKLIKRINPDTILYSRSMESFTFAPNDVESFYYKTHNWVLIYKFLALVAQNKFNLPRYQTVYKFLICNFYNDSECSHTIRHSFYSSFWVYSKISRDGMVVFPHCISCNMSRAENQLIMLSCNQENMALRIECAYKETYKYFTNPFTNHDFFDLKNKSLKGKSNPKYAFKFHVHYFNKGALVYNIAVNLEKHSFMYNNTLNPTLLFTPEANKFNVLVLFEHMVSRERIPPKCDLDKLFNCAGFNPVTTAITYIESSFYHFFLELAESDFNFTEGMNLVFLRPLKKHACDKYACTGKDYTLLDLDSIVRKIIKNINQPKYRNQVYLRYLCMLHRINLLNPGGIIFIEMIENKMNFTYTDIFSSTTILNNVLTFLTNKKFDIKPGHTYIKKSARNIKLISEIEYYTTKTKLTENLGKCINFWKTNINIFLNQEQKPIAQYILEHSNNIKKYGNISFKDCQENTLPIITSLLLNYTKHKVVYVNKIINILKGMGLHILDSSVSGGGPKEDGGSREGGKLIKFAMKGGSKVGDGADGESKAHVHYHTHDCKTKFILNYKLLIEVLEMLPNTELQNILSEFEKKFAPIIKFIYNLKLWEWGLQKNIENFEIPPNTITEQVLNGLKPFLCKDSTNQFLQQIKNFLFVKTFPRYGTNQPQRWRMGKLTRRELLACYKVRKNHLQNYLYYKLFNDRPEYVKYFILDLFYERINLVNNIKQAIFDTPYIFLYKSPPDGIRIDEGLQFQNEVNRIFKTYDTDNNGKLDYDELMNLKKNPEESWSHNSLEIYMKYFPIVLKIYNNFEFYLNKLNNYVLNVSESNIYFNLNIHYDLIPYLTQRWAGWEKVIDILSNANGVVPHILRFLQKSFQKILHKTYRNDAMIGKDFVEFHIKKLFTNHKYIGEWNSIHKQIKDEDVWDTMLRIIVKNYTIRPYYSLWQMKILQNMVKSSKKFKDFLQRKSPVWVSIFEDDNLYKLIELMFKRKIAGKNPLNTYIEWIYLKGNIEPILSFPNDNQKYKKASEKIPFFKIGKIDRKIIPSILKDIKMRHFINTINTFNENNIESNIGNTFTYLNEIKNAPFCPYKTIDKNFLKVLLARTIKAHPFERSVSRSKKQKRGGGKLKKSRKNKNKKSNIKILIKEKIEK